MKCKQQHRLEVSFLSWKSLLLNQLFDLHFVFHSAVQPRGKPTYWDQTGFATPVLLDVSICNLVRQPFLVGSEKEQSPRVFLLKLPS